MTTQTTTSASTNPLVDAARRVEQAQFLDPLVAVVRPLVNPLVRREGVRNVLQGQWLGHAVHPLLTDLPLGMWLSASVLDLVGGPDSRPAARRLVGLGLLAAVPTAITGAAEWAAVDERRDRRTGLVHATADAGALTLYARSWRARARGEHATGVVLAMAGGVAATISGFLGGHLTEARKVSSRHPSFEQES